jgi:hypothetical protein
MNELERNSGSREKGEEKVEPKVTSTSGILRILLALNVAEFSRMWSEVLEKSVNFLAARFLNFHGSPSIG